MVSLQGPNHCSLFLSPVCFFQRCFFAKHRQSNTGQTTTLQWLAQCCSVCRCQSLSSFSFVNWLRRQPQFQQSRLSLVRNSIPSAWRKSGIVDSFCCTDLLTRPCLLSRQIGWPKSLSSLYFSPLPTKSHSTCPSQTWCEIVQGDGGQGQRTAREVGRGWHLPQGAG